MGVVDATAAPSALGQHLGSVSEAEEVVMGDPNVAVD